MARPRENVEERFWRYVNKTAKCWTWTGSKFRMGYGQFHVSGKNLKAHRFSYELFKDQIPEGFFVCHKCDNPSCVRPSHLFIGDPKANVADMISKCRRADTSGEKNGQSRITRKIAVDIRNKYSKNETKHPRMRKLFSQQKLAEKYGITQTMIGKIIRKKAWI